MSQIKLILTEDIEMLTGAVIEVWYDFVREEYIFKVNGVRIGTKDYETPK